MHAPCVLPGIGPRVAHGINTDSTTSRASIFANHPKPVRKILSYLEMGIQTPMAQGQSTKTISLIKRTRTSRLSIQNSLSLCEQSAFVGNLADDLPHSALKGHNAWGSASFWAYLMRCRRCLFGKTEAISLGCAGWAAYLCLLNIVHIAAGVQHFPTKFTTLTIYYYQYHAIA